MDFTADISRETNQIIESWNHILDKNLLTINGIQLQEHFYLSSLYLLINTRGYGREVRAVFNRYLISNT